VDYFAVVAVVDGADELAEQVEGVFLRKLSVGLGLPQLIQLSPFQVLHRDYKLLLLWKWKVVKQLNDVLVLQLPESFNLFGYHMRVLV
jgi:hypothetical protein